MPERFFVKMVARNFSVQDLPYSRLLSVPDDEREFLTLEELKPHHLTELTGQNPSHQQLTEDFQQNLHLNHGLVEQEYNVYYDLNTQQPK